MVSFILKKQSFFVIDEWQTEHDGLIAGFTTKNGGKSEYPYASLNMGFHVGDVLENVIDNRTILANELNMPLNTWVGAKQTHETQIKKVSIADGGQGAADYESAFERTDGFFTYDSGLLLTLCYADCVPLFFVAPKHKAIAAAHAGWRGTVDGIAERVVSTFIEENIAPAEIKVAIGPSICEKCYIVDDRVIKFVENKLEDVEKKPYNQIKGNQYHLNLQTLNQMILQKAGIPKANISTTSLCTCCDNEHFFSHRGDNGQTGRMMSFIGWKESAK